ncbi:MAG TPA: hypothetical protein VJJ81_02530 [Candidatus Babeliales bacterium]|nr:hypothetical protein [Candidatus Babeliales bacterium]
MCKFKQLILITSLVVSGVSNANSESSSRIAKNLINLWQCKRVIAPNYVLNPRSELDNCIANNSTEFLAIERECKTVEKNSEVNGVVDRSNQIITTHLRDPLIADLHRAYDDAVTYNHATQVLGRVAAGVVIPAACLIVVALAVEAIKFGSSARR